MAEERADRARTPLAHPDAWETEVARFRAAVDVLATRPKDGAWPVHAAFGRLSGAQWGRLLYRHTDYHFKQFGV